MKFAPSLPVQPLLAALQEGLLFFSPDGEIVYVNEATGILFGWAPEALVGRHIDTVLPQLLATPPSSEDFRDTIPMTAMSMLQGGRLETMGHTKSGEERELVLKLSEAYWESLEESLYFCTIRDVTRRNRSIRELREQLTRHALALEGSQEGWWHWDFTQNQLDYSSRWWEILGYEEPLEQHDPQAWLLRIHPEDRAHNKDLLSAHLKQQSLYFDSQFRLRRADNAYRWMHARGLAQHDELGNPVRMAGVMTDIDAQRTIQESYSREALYDKLTGLANRVLLLDLLQRALTRIKDNKDKYVALLVFDIDRFKNINDALGHDIGDKLLKEIGHRLHRTLTPTQIPARLSGDEFAVLLEGLELHEKATHVAEQIKSDLSLPFHIEGHDIAIKVSVGISVSHRNYERSEDMLRDANAAMNQAKGQGKDRYELFVTDFRLQALSMLQIENDLRRAIDHKEFLLYYQPIVDLATHELYGFEALLRWRSPKGAFLSPASFIPIAEETGLIVPIGQWVLEEAFAQMQRWQEEMPTARLPLMSINLSGKQFEEEGLLQQLKELLQRSSVPGKCFKLEVTESVIMDDMAQVEAILSQLKEQEILLSIDDFGTGYSSLSLLHQLPFDTLKIDRSFIRNIPRDKKKIGIVKTIVSLARSLGMSLIAEGVETKEQLDFLATLDCEYIQGYYFSKPLPAQEATACLVQAPWQTKS